MRSIPIKKIIFTFFILCLAGTGLLFFIYKKVESYDKFIYSNISEISEAPVALVFGAGVRPNGRLSDALADRVLTAIELYNAGKVKKLLMTGDNSTQYYDEVTAMKKFAVERGVKEEDIVLDYAGFDTYDSCYRAKAIFDQTQVVAVSQEFHLPRVLYTCNQLGIQSVGVTADKHRYLLADSWKVREFMASVKAWLDVEIFHSKPKFLGQKEKVF